MKLTAILLTVALLQVHAKSFPQVTLSLKNAPVEKVFFEIERQAGFGFLYTKNMLAGLPKVSIHVRNATVNEVLNECFKGQPLEYSIENNMIIVREKMIPAPSTPLAELPPPVQISGRVITASGEPIANVSVIIVGSKTGTTTNNDGRFNLTAPDNKNIVLEFSSVGYVTQRVNAGNQTTVNVVLELDVAGLSDIVVVGYGTQKRSDVTGAISSVSAEKLTQVKGVSNIAGALQGQAPGVQVIQRSGQPGEGVSIKIRGTNSIQAGNDPLYVVDGLPLDGLTAQLNPSDIETIEVLKDASSTAIYGSRGANGVIMITTKKGREGKARVTYNGYYGVQSLRKKWTLSMHRNLQYFRTK